MPDETTARLSSLGIAPGALPAFQKFIELLKTAGRRINLISYTTDRELFEHHLWDSLMALSDGKARARARALVVDVGTGGGFPGIPLAIARPGWSVTLLDSVRKKLAALEGIIGELGLETATLWGRSEDLARDAVHRETFDIALCRAVGSLACVLELTLPLVRVGGFCLLHRGADLRKELDACPEALAVLGGEAGNVIPYTLSGLDRDRFILRIDKTHQTQSKFPRRAGVPAKKPLSPKIKS